MVPARRAAIVAGVVALAVGGDQATKHLADLTLKDHAPIQFLGDAVRLLYAQNTGAWGSLGADWPGPVKTLTFVTLPALVLIAVVVGLFRRRDVHVVEIVAYSLLLGGGVGNMIDRLMQGYVVDFMYIGLGGLGTNIFNVADVAVVTGVLLLFWLGFKNRGTATNPAPAPKV